MSKNPTERHEGHKVQLWVSDDLYAALKARAVRHDTHLVDELRQAAMAGLDPLNGFDAIYDAVTKLTQFARLHLEPLAFIAAMDAAYSRESWRLQFYGSRPNDAAEVDRKLGERATKRLQRKLRALEPKEPEGQVNTDDDGDAEEDED